MKRFLGGVVAGLLAAGLAVAGEVPHWGYEGHEGPAHWEELSPEFWACGKGKNQSPVDLRGFIEAGLAPLEISYAEAPLAVVNNGHTIQVNYPAGSTLTVDGRTFVLKQFHFHAPSENTVEGKSFPLEAHFVHADDQGNLAVLALLFEQGEENPELAKIWAHMPASAGSQASPEGVSVRADALLPASRDYYRYNGSLTTPPCTEGVLWLVLKTPATVSAEQVEAFRHVMHHDNNRPVQPLNARAVLR
ncbi:carbonic anhydrase [Deferrisoma palaeochoriense]